MTFKGEDEHDVGNKNDYISPEMVQSQLEVTVDRYLHSLHV